MRLYLLQTALTGAHGAPVPVYLIRTDDGTNILVDSGFPPEMLAQTRHPVNMGMAIRDAVPLVDLLAALGLAPTDIHYLIATHLDPDHAGGHDLFPNAEIVVQRIHYAEATASDNRRYAINRPHWDAPGLRYRLVDGDTTLVPGMELIETSGHVTGHQSVLVRLPNTGPVLLTIDAINYAAQQDPDMRTVADYDEDEAATRASTRKLRAIEVREGVALTIYGHDYRQWPTLRHAPRYYD